MKVIMKIIGWTFILPGLALFILALFGWLAQMGQIGSAASNAEVVGGFLGASLGGFMFGFLGLSMMIVGKILLPSRS
jgi:hypothetical protein